MKNTSVKLAFALSASVMFSVGYLSCSSGGGGGCDASTCPTGCCDSTGMCQNPNISNCGNDGAACVQCTSGQQCKAGSCVGPASGGGTAGTGGGTAATGGGTASTGGGTAATGGGTAATGGGTAATGGGTAAAGGGTAATGGGTAATGGGTGTGGGSGATCTMLTVKNEPSTPWCNIKVNGVAIPQMEVSTLCVDAGTVTLSAEAESSTFTIGDWHDTAGDPGVRSGDGGVSTTTIVVGSTPACAWICCPFQGGTGCPTANQCP